MPSRGARTLTRAYYVVAGLLAVAAVVVAVLGAVGAAAGGCEISFSQADFVIGPPPTGPVRPVPGEAFPSCQQYFDVPATAMAVGLGAALLLTAVLFGRPGSAMRMVVRGGALVGIVVGALPAAFIWSLMTHHHGAPGPELSLELIADPLIAFAVLPLLAGLMAAWVTWRAHGSGPSASAAPYLGAFLLLTACAGSSAGPSPSQTPEATPAAASPSSIAGTYECRRPGDTGTGPGFHLVWIWEIREDGTLTITDQVDASVEGTWSVEGDSGIATVEGSGNPFSIVDDRLVFADFVCTRPGSEPAGSPAAGDPLVGAYVCSEERNPGVTHLWDMREDGTITRVSGETGEVLPAGTWSLDSGRLLTTFEGGITWFAIEGDDLIGPRGGWVCTRAESASISGR